MTEPITIIGAETVVSGNLEGDEDLTIEGRVEGSITLSKTLTVEVGGVVRANINVRNAIISGVLVGNIEAQESVHITDQGRVVGDIAAPRVILVDGASFRGNIDMGDFDVEQTEEKPARAAAPRPTVSRPVAARPAVTRQERPAPAANRTTAPSTSSANSAQANAATSGTSTASSSKASHPAEKKSTARPVPTKKKVTKSPPAPKVRAIGKKSGSKKK